MHYSLALTQRKLIIGAIVVVMLLLIGGFTYQRAWQTPEAIVRINVINHGVSLPGGFFLYQHLSAKGIAIKSITSNRDSLTISFNSTDDSHAAQRVLATILDNSYRIE